MNVLEGPKTVVSQGFLDSRPFDSHERMSAAGPEGCNPPTPAQPPTTRRLDVISMAAGWMPIPGSEYGPCVEDCSHRDCASTRARAASACPYCSGDIGYDVRFYFEGDDNHPVHAVCAEVEALS